MNNRLIGLDILRAFAAISIVIYHYNYQEVLDQTSFFTLTLGTFWNVVDLFFVLSGFLISTSWFSSLEKSEENPLRKFYIRRFLRTLPLYYIIVIFYFLQNHFIMGRGFPLTDFIFFLQNYGDMANFELSWSLCIEEHFYILFPLLSFYFIKKKNFHLFSILLLIIPFISMIFRYLAVSSHPEMILMGEPFKPNLLFQDEIYVKTHMRLDGLAFGVLLGHIKINYLKAWNFLQNHKGKTFLLGILIYFIVTVLLHERYSIFSMTYSFYFLSFSFFLMISSLHDYKIKNDILSKVITHFANLSYPLYLNHFVVFYLYDVACIKLGIVNGKTMPHFIASLVLVYISAYVTNLLIEKPSLTFRKKVLKI